MVFPAAGADDKRRATTQAALVRDREHCDMEMTKNEQFVARRTTLIGTTARPLGRYGAFPTWPVAAERNRTSRMTEAWKLRRNYTQCL